MTRKTPDLSQIPIHFFFILPPTIIRKIISRFLMLSIFEHHSTKIIIRKIIHNTPNNTHNTPNNTHNLFLIHRAATYICANAKPAMFSRGR